MGTHARGVSRFYLDVFICVCGMSWCTGPWVCRGVVEQSGHMHLVASVCVLRMSWVVVRMYLGWKGENVTRFVSDGLFLDQLSGNVAYWPRYTSWLTLRVYTV